MRSTRLEDLLKPNRLWVEEVVLLLQMQRLYILFSICHILGLKSVFVLGYMLLFYHEEGSPNAGLLLCVIEGLWEKEEQ